MNSIDILGDPYCQYISNGYELSKRVSTEFAEWYKKEILVCTERTSMLYIDKEGLQSINNRKKYVEGYAENGGVTLDASRFGVTNIYEAVQLFKNFLHF